MIHVLLSKNDRRSACRFRHSPDGTLTLLSGSLTSSLENHLRTLARGPLPMRQEFLENDKRLIYSQKISPSDPRFPLALRDAINRLQPNSLVCWCEEEGDVEALERLIRKALDVDPALRQQLLERAKNLFPIEKDLLRIALTQKE